MYEKLAFWLDMAEKLAKGNYDGHLAIMRFTRGWKVMFGTPDLDGGDGRWEIRGLANYPSLEAALKAIVVSELENLE